MRNKRFQAPSSCCTTRNFQDGIARSSKLIQEYTYPVLRVGTNKLPEQIGSCVFVNVDGDTYLISAAHVVRENTGGLITSGDGHLIDVIGHAIISRDERMDHFDIASIRMSEDTVQVNRIRVVEPLMLVTAVEVENPRARAICGFPTSMNKQNKSVDEVNRVVTGKSYAYFGFAEFRGEFGRFGKHAEAHIGLECGAGTDDTGKYLTTPPWPPHGLSGGGAWLIPDLDQPEQVFLEAIFIEAHKHAKKMYCFSTRIEHVIDFVRAEA